ncbi:S49 family peptidase [Rhodovulum sulfidophilum]|uniref:S49 family peptidase n=1 Tax=Rhodovulum visakhapatnamense TaxID=364297 RepID=A0ABS1RE22_9RHOB|nr:S49 family peptidase [Rhodovulum visakhapatnamense]MBL3569660.1 S49 family peptidase [Rhodovulum visakhapatnamense]MBL3577892.1 S49 family peptidase [Rhodovulum visakhapatnamense]OLS43697.1 S49 family peptidase [Rhodovulum sulfidophilum]
MKRWLPFVKSDPLVSVVRLSGTIAASARGNTLSDAALAPVIERAFKKGKPDAVALIVNSPGGSPAQSALIAARVRRLAEERNTPVISFVEDVAASGGYWLACAGDEIWLDASSIAGSIGVIYAGFGFQDLIARYGVERRVHTAGESKSFLDPFKPEKPEDVARLIQLQEPIHEAFKAHVRARRGDRLKTDRDLFTGDVWVGQQAVEVGLADGIGHLVPKMKERFGDKVRFALHAPRRGLLSRLGAPGVAAVVDEVEARLLWSRYGL